ncbi:hypothetical protein F4778DRAFT_66380 [Xylariomycetidae sp. FL2044]|nr:hypothetical protein F4778DRAFT_66380 [Xylariomycetidae sp. FL2044]
MKSQMADSKGLRVSRLGGKPKVIRPLGHLELFECGMMAIGHYQSNAISCQYSIPERLQTPERHADVVEYFENAIASVVLDHPLLHAGLLGAKSRKPKWVQLDSIDFGEFVQWQVLDDASSVDYGVVFRELVQKRVDIPYPDAEIRLGWRITILRVTAAAAAAGDFLEVMFEWDHAVSDGMGAKIFHEELLRALNKPVVVAKDGETTKPAAPLLQNRVLTITPPSPTESSSSPSSSSSSSSSSSTPSPPKFPPPFDKLCKHTYTPRWLLSAAWAELKPPLLSRKKNPYMADWAPILHTPPIRTQYRLFSIPQEGLQRLLAACRAHKTTLTGLLGGLSILSLAARLPADRAKGLSALTALDMRRFIVAAGGSSSTSSGGGEIDPDRTIANLVSVIPHEFSPELVAEMRRRLATAATMTMRTTTTTTTDAKEKMEEEEGLKKKGVGGETIIIPLSPELRDVLWQTARQVRGDIVDRLGEGLKNQLTGIMGLVRDWRAYHRDRARKPRGTAVGLTNLGVIGDGVGGEEEGKKEENWRIRRAVFALSAEVSSSAIVVSPMAARGGELCVGWVWQEGIVEEGLMEGVVRDVEGWLGVLGGKGEGEEEDV